MKIFHVRALAAVTTALTLSFAGCSLGSTTPGVDTLWKQVTATLSSAKSVHVKGTVKQSGKEVTIDIAGARDGSNQKVLMTQAGANSEILTVDGTNYIKGDKAFWASQGASSIDDAKLSKYVAIKATSNSSQTTGAMLDNMAKTGLNLADLVNLKVDPATLDGQNTYLISERVASKSNAKVWVSTDAAPKLVRVEGTDDSGAVSALGFSEWDAVAPFAAPPADQVVTP